MRTDYAYSKTILVAVLTLFFSGCQVADDLDIWPLVLYERDFGKQQTKLDVLEAFYSYRDNQKQTTHALRPFFVGEFSKEQDISRMLFLWPFGLFSQDPQELKVWLLPFYYYRDRQFPELGERDFDWFFLPFMALGGVDSKEGAYQFLTAWGNIKGILGYDEIKMTPFPFYVEAKDGGYTTRGYLWPFFRFGDGDDRKFRFYAMMYSYYERKGKFRRRSYLWPFFHYNEENLHRNYPSKEFLFFPIYGQAITDVSVNRAILWPFFTYAYDTKSNYSEYNLPWPFFKLRNGKNVEEFRLWPFYWNSQRNIEPQGKQQDLILMWPFYWHLQSDFLSYEKESLYVLPFYWSHWRKGKEEGGEITRRVKIWPLLSYEQQADGTKRYRGISPLWFEDYLPYGIEKAWLPLVTLFDYSSGPKGAETVSLLGPLYQYKQDAESLYHRIMFFSYKEKEDYKRFSVLGGLFEYRVEQGKNKLRFFYLPPFISWGKSHEAQSKK